MRAQPESSSQLGHREETVDHRVDLVRNFELVEMSGPNCATECELRAELFEPFQFGAVA